MLAASIRSTYHLKKTLEFNSDLATVPAKVYKEWLELSEDEKQKLENPMPNLSETPAWKIPDELLNIKSLQEFMSVLETNKLNIKHELTDAGIDKFVADWSTILH